MQRAALLGRVGEIKVLKSSVFEKAGKDAQFKHRVNTACVP
jgi:hypothetical protein